MNEKCKIELGKELARHDYQPVELNGGYAGRTLFINLGANEILEKPLSQQMKDKFIGGKGFDLRLMWDIVNEKTKWDSPENAICISPGPLAGTTSYPGSGKSLVTSISPLTDIPIDSNVGGFFGPFLKFSGFDALAVTGKAKNDVLIHIDGVKHFIKIQEMTASNEDAHVLCGCLTERIAPVKTDRQYVSVVAAGQGADNTYFGILNFSYYDWRRKEARYKQAGRGGIGTVFRDKKILAMVIRSDNWKPRWSITVG
jgi:aldehyde:ferredoxin oxidoreductase